MLNSKSDLIEYLILVESDYYFETEYNNRLLIDSDIRKKRIMKLKKLFSTKINNEI